MRVFWGQFTGHFAGGRQREALAMAQNLLALAERSDDLGGRLIGHASMGASLLHLGSFAGARAQFEQALAITPDPTSERESVHLYGQSGRAAARAYLALDLLILDETDAARHLAEEAVKEAAGWAHPTSLCFAHSVATRIFYLLGDRRALSQHSAMVVRLADEHGLALWRALGSIYMGWTQAESGAISQGAAMIHDGLAKYRAVGAALSLPLYLSSLAIIEARAGHHQVARDLLNEAQQACAAGEEQWIAAELQRLTGEAILVLDGDSAAAIDRFRAALVLARQQGARLWEKRAAASLDAVLHNANQPGATRPATADADPPHPL
jgi:predicted ATPase